MKLYLLREFRKKKAITQIEVAEILKINNGTYAKYERGERIPNIQKLMTIFRILELSKNQCREILDLN